MICNSNSSRQGGQNHLLAGGNLANPSWRTWLKHASILCAILTFGHFDSHAQRPRTSAVSQIPGTDPSRDIPGYDQAKAALVQPSLGSIAPVLSPVTAPAPGTASNTSYSMNVSGEGDGGITQLPSCWIPIDASYSSLAGNDDGSTALIPLPFTFQLYGTNYTSCYLNNNGNVTFTGPFGTFTASGFPLGGTPMLAPFWADVDTRTGGLMYYKVFPTRVVVTWEAVGYYSTQTDKLNTFQIVFGTNNDPVIGLGQNVCFHYGDMQWTTGSASNGVGGFGGVAATVGINEGNGVDYVQVGRFSINSSVYDGPGGADDGISFLDDKCLCFDVDNSGNIPPSASTLPPNNRVNLACGETLNFPVTFIAPEVNQSVTVSVNTGGLCNTTFTTTSGATATANITIVGAPCNQGTNTITVTGTDNGVPPASATEVITVIVGSCCNLTATIASTTPVSCAGTSTGAVDLSIAGAGGAVSYIWSNGATTQDLSNVPAGTYSVTVTSVGCTATASATVGTTTDVTPPVIACPANITVNNATNQCAANVSYITPVGTDNCPGASTSQTVGLPSGASFPVGTTTNTFRVNAANGQAAICSFTVTVVDNQPPTISCPSNGTVNTSPGQCSAIASYLAPAGADNCPGVTTALTAGVASGSTIGLGASAFTFTATAANGQTASCSFTITVVDNQAPTITCPPNINVNTDANACAAVVTYATPVGGDNCPGVAVALQSGLASGSSFPIGTSTVTYRATGSGGSAICSFTVTVTDLQSPSISCPANISVNNAPSACAAAVSFTAPVGTDNCPGASTSQTAGLASGASFTVGVTTNSFTVTAGGLTATCSFTVTVVDNEAPAISCPANISVNNAPNACAATVSYAAPVGTDNCPGASTSQTAGLASGASFPVGVTTNTFVVTATGGTATCSFTVTVVDNEAPVISCPANISVNNAPNTCAATVSYTAPVGTDNCPGASTSQTAGLASGASFPVGTTTNTFVVTAVGGTATCSFTVTVVDNEAPAISCPANISVNNAPGTCAATASYTAPVGTDTCPGASTSQTAGLASGASFPVGVTTNTFVVTAGGGTATCSFTVTVVDNEAPAISCPANISVNNDPGQCAATVSFTAPVGTDNCPGASTSQTAGLASGASFPVGTTANTFVVTAVGGTATCSFTVTVTDNEAPTISCPGDMSIINDPGQCSAVISYAAPVGTDNCPGASTSQTAGLASGSSFPVGLTTNTFVVTAVGGTATCSFIIRVADNEAPVISCPADISVNNDPGQCGAVVSYTTPGGTDNCPGASTSQTAGLASGSSFPVGTTTNTFEVAAGIGNASCSFTVTVTDNEAPAISCPANISANNAPNTCAATVSYTAPVGTDNCPGASTSQTAGLASGASFPVGVTTNTFEVTAVGGTASCSFTVTVVDNQAPVISCPTNITVCAPQGAATAVVSYTAPVGTDNCPGASTALTSGFASGANFPVGTTTVTYTTTAANGQQASCSFTVTVNQFSTFSTIFTETIGTVSGTTSIASHEGNNGFDNDPFTMSGTGDIRNTTPSTGYSGASGLGNVFLTTAGSSFTISGINTTSFTPGTMALAFGFFKSTTGSTGNELAVAFSADGTTFTPMVFAPGATSATWRSVNAVGAIPAVPNLRIRFTNTSSSVQFRVDDIVLVGSSLNPTIGASGPLSFCPGGSVTLAVGPAASYLWNTGATTQSIVASTAGTYQVTMTSANGCQAVTPPVTVTVFSSPTVSATGINATCPGSNNGSATATGAGGTGPYTFLWSNGQTTATATNLGAGTYTVVASDANGCPSTPASVTLTDLDIVPPVAICRNVTVQLDATGNGSTTAAAVNNGSTDNCSISGLALSNTAFTCANVATANTVTLTVTDVGGNTSTCTATVVVLDNIAPTALCQNVTVQLDASGNGSTSAAAVNNGSSDACGVAGFSLSNTAFTCANVAAAPVVTDLFISEYIEGTSNNKCIEIYNGTGAPVNLSTYSLRFYNNGSTTPTTTITLSGTVANGDVFVVCDDNSATLLLAQADLVSTASFFNGNDAVELRKGSTALDIIGRIGQDPGTEWTGGGLSTFDRTLVRKGNVWSGNTANALNFPSLATEWNGFPLDNSANLGSHTLNSGNSVTLTVTDVNGNTSTCNALVSVQDNIAPTALCQDVTVQLDATGNGSTTAAAANNGSSDNCAIASLVLSQTAFVCSEVGANTETLTVTDVNGNVSTCTTTFTVQDNVAPVATCQNLTVQLDATGNASITAAQINNGSMDACGISSLSLDNTTFNCANVNGNTVTLTVTDVNNNSSTCTSTVSILDIIAPTAICQDLTVQLDATGNGSTTAAAANNGSSDNCAIASLVLSQTAFVCSEVGANTETLTVTDVNGNSSTCTTTVTVQDNVAPVAICQDVTVQLDATGNASISPAQVNNGSSDACGIANLSLDNTTFNCANVNGNTVTLTVTDVNGNSSTCTAQVSIQDSIAPNALCQGVTVQLDATGNGSTTAAAVNNGSSDNCAIASLSIDISTFNCSNIGSNTVVLMVLDVNGNSSNCTAQVVVQDQIAPSITCPPALTLDCGSSTSPTLTGTASATDNCSVAAPTFTDANNLVLCNNTGTITRTWVAIDGSGNTSSCTQVLTIRDITPPVIVVPAQNLTVECDGAGNQTEAFNYYASNGGAIANDACGTVIWGTPTFTAPVQGCGYTLTVTATFTATDACGNSASTSGVFRILDTTPPALVVPANVTVQCSSSTAQAATGTATATDACTVLPGSTNYWVNEIHYDNAGADVNEFIEIAGTAGLNLAGISIVLYDGATGTVYNTIPLSGVLPNQQAGFGTRAFFIPGIQEDIDGIALVSGTTVTQFLSYEGVFVATNGPAIGMTSRLITAAESGSTLANRSITLIGAGSTYNQFTWFGAQTSPAFAATPNLRNLLQNFTVPTGIALTFTDVNSLGGCNNTGTITRTWRATDGCGNISTGVQTINVVDNTAPVAVCSNVTVQLDASGNGSTTASAVNNGSSDNCGSVSLSLNLSSFSCANVGANPVVLTVADNCGNTSTCTAIVTVQDNVAPVAICQDVTVQLDATGNASISPAQVNNGSSDACGIASLSLDNTTFNCANVNGNTVTLTVTDVNGNSSTCTATVSILDSIAPTALCQDLTVQLDATGNGSTTAAAANNGSSDNCAIASLVLSQTAFVCAEVGANTETLTVTDVNGNVSTCTTVVTVQDNVAPVALCQNVTVQLDATGNGSTTAQLVDNGSNDACGIASLSLNLSSFTCADIVGASPLDLIISEYVEGTGNNKYIELYNAGPSTKNLGDYQLRLFANGAATPTQTNTLSGSLAPGGTIVYRNVLATAYTGPASVLTGVNWNGDDAIMLYNNSTSQVVDIFGRIGDDPGAAWTSGANTTVDRTLRRKPAVLSGVQVNPTGTGPGAFTTLGGQWDVFPTDVVSGLGAHSVSAVGNSVTLTATDVNGNISTCTAMVTVQDNVAPNAICQDVTVQLGAAGTGTTNAAAVNNGSSDACGIAFITLSNTTFNCANVGPNTVTLSVSDQSGNVGTCTAIVTVQDNVVPSAVCQDLTVQLDATGNGSTSAAAINNGSSDNCGVASMSINPSAFTCADVAGEPASGLFISEYTEGSSNNKCIEIFNGTGSAVNLSGYSLVFYFNGSSSPATTIALSGTVANGDVFVVCDDNANALMLAQADQVSTSNFYNGNDAVELRNGSTAIDIIGSIGQDPGTAWTAGGLSTMDRTLVRRANVFGGNTANEPGFPSLFGEWTGLGVDNSSDLGMHTFSNGTNLVVLTVTDVNGNSSTCNSAVTVQDNVAPVAICQDITVQLDATGNASITPAQIGNGSNDACGIASLGLDNTTFNCANVNGNTVTLTVTDVNGNSSTCTAQVSIQDSIAPTAICQDITAYLDTTGFVQIGAALLNNGSFDNCAIDTIFHSQCDFFCENVGPNTVTLTVVDVNGNSSTCTSVVTVVDSIAPGELCMDATVYLDASGLGSITTGDIVDLNAAGYASDNCDVTYVISDSLFDCSNVGANNLVVTATDPSGNVTTCTSVVTVIDSIDPTAICQDITAYLDTAGFVQIGAALLNNGSFDNCAIDTIFHSQCDFFCENVGANTVTLTVVDVNGNSSTCTSVVTVVDSIAPGDLCQDATVYLNATGNGSITTGDIVDLNAAGYASDNCDVSYVISDSLFDCSNVGANNVVVTATDPSGNVTTCTSVVTVIDSIAPNAICQSITINLGSSGSQVVLASAVDNGSNDACGIASVTLNPNTFSCDDLGENPVTLTVVDVNGNSSTCNATVTVTNDALVVSLSSNTFQCGTNVSCNGATDGSISSTVVGGCAPYSYLWSNGSTSANPTGLGAGTYTLTVTDQNGTTATATITLTEPALLVGSGVPSEFSCGFNVSCNGATNGAVDYTATGGCAPYSYTWSTGATTEDVSGLGAGTYSVTTTDANGCTATNSFTLSEPTLLAGFGTVPTFSCGFNVSCNGGDNGSIDYGVEGGCQPYSYLWSNGATTQDVGGLVAGTYTVTVTDANGCTATNSFTLTEPAPIVGTATSPTFACGFNISCNGATNGSIDYSVVGGCAPYTYLWSTGATTQDISGLGAGTYTVTTTDANGCTSANSFTITGPAQLTGSGVLSQYACGFNISCNGASNGSVDYSVVGGCAPYTYLWSTGATTEDISGRPAGTYSVTVTDANGCTTSNSFTLIQPTPLAVTSTPVVEFTPRVNAVCGYNVHCFGGNDGQFTVNFAGGASCTASTVVITGPVTQTQTGIGSVTFSNLFAGTYTILVTDANGCTASAPSVTLTQPSPLVASAGPDRAVNYGFQSQHCVVLTGTRSGGISPYVGRWNIGSATGPLVSNNTSVQVCPTVTTTYCYTVTDDFGCRVTDCMTICVTDIRCGTAPARVNVCTVPPGNPGNPQTLCIPNGQVPAHLAANPGSYMGSCGAVPCSNNKGDAGSSAAALEDDAEGLFLSAFPNPFSDATTIRFKLGQADEVGVKVYSMTGVLVATLFEGQAEGGMNYDLEFRPEGVANGVYLAKVVTKGGEVQVQKLILNR